MQRAARLMLALALSVSGAAFAAEGDLQRRQAQAQRDHDALRLRIGKLEKQIAGSESSRRDISVALRESESAISELDRKLENLAADTRRAEADLKTVQQRIGEQSAELGKRQADLADQLRAQYAGGLSPWAALLSGEDPQDIARELGYLEYVARAQTDAVHAVRTALDELAVLQAKAQTHEADLRRLAQETTQRRAELDTQRAERAKVLARIEGQLKQQRSEAKSLAGNEARLGKLVDALAVAIEEEAAAARRRAEEARQAEERRLAEVRRQAEAAQRQAEEARRLAAAQAASAAQAEESRKIEEARRTAQAIREGQAAAPAPQVATAPVAEPPPAPAPAPAPAATPEPPAPAVASLTPPAPLQGLNKGLPHPVRGEVHGRFGMERPEGGIWRGIVLRASEGARVGAVAPGRVVYAGWLGGFGNLIIVDHGDKYLSVYAYNQALLRQVGDHVKTGEAIATVGATGGQVEPGLYFEIRHDGQPVNPLLWLKS